MLWNVRLETTPLLMLAATTDLQTANCIDHCKLSSRKGYFISCSTAVLMAVFYVCSLVVTGLLVFYCVPRSSSLQLEGEDMSLRSLTTRRNMIMPHHKTRNSNRLPTHIIPTHYR